MTSRDRSSAAGLLPLGLESVRLTESEMVRDGLEDMLRAAIGEHGHDLGGLVEPGLALLVIEAAKRAEAG